jgi:hypothetical protein
MDDASAYRMPFGQHKGRTIEQLPDDYLDWLHGLGDLRPRLRAAVDAEIARRRPARGMVATLADEIVTTGYRHVARRCHPDTGGSHEAMIAATAAADWLRAQLRGLHA